MVWAESERGTDDERCKTRHAPCERKFPLRAENDRLTATKYFVDLHAQLRALDDEIDGSVTQKVIKNGLLLVADTVGRASTSAYF